MANSTGNWESVYRFVTAGTPNLGVYGFLGQLNLAAINGGDFRDLSDDSDFIFSLADAWQNMSSQFEGNIDQAQNRKWGVVAGLSPADSRSRNDPTQIDGAGVLVTEFWSDSNIFIIPFTNSNIGLVEMWSAIPGEWLLATQNNFDTAIYNTPNYGMRYVFEATHSELLTNSKIQTAIKWADSDRYYDIPNTPGYSLDRHANYNYQLGENDYRNNYPLTFTGNVINLQYVLTDVVGDWWNEQDLFQNSVSSVHVDASGFAITLHADATYLGQSLTIEESVPYLSDYNFNDILTSIEVEYLDDDADGIPNFWEEFYDLNPNDASDADDDPDGDALTNFKEYTYYTNPNRSNADGLTGITFFQNFYADDDTGQCNGAAYGELFAPLNSWTNEIRIDTDGRSGGCYQQFAIYDPNHFLDDVTIKVNFWADGDGQCDIPGEREIPIYDAGDIEWSSAYLIDADNRGGGCQQKFTVEGRDDVYLDIYFEKDGDGQCENTGTHTASLNNPVQVRIDTDNRNGGCRQKFRLRIEGMELDDDYDADGISNSDELELGTQPFESDSDGDGLSDGDEVNLYLTDPLDEDSDNDGVADGNEVSAGSDSLSSSETGCAPTGSGDWDITSSCTLFSSVTAPANVYVRNGAVLTIPAGLSLDLDLRTNKLVVASGSGVLIKHGGKIY